MQLVIVSCVLFFISGGIVDAASLVITILSQSNEYHQQLAEELQSDIYSQSGGSVAGESPVVYLSHVDFPHVGAWAVTPLITHLADRHRENCVWFVFVEDRTGIKLATLNSTLQEYDCSKESWLGYAMQDAAPTIIHHFAFFENCTEFNYPRTASGFAISGALLKTLVTRAKSETGNFDFAIDHAFELALFIRNDGTGPALIHEPNFCITENRGCATYTQLFESCDQLLPKEALYFAVKTCKKFHAVRVPVVLRTWGVTARHIQFFSDSKDDSIPTISLGIPNTERGHCAKTFRIIKYVAQYIEKLPRIKWIIIADDDTILSVVRLRELLTCYDENAPVALGERYGYNIHSQQGYNYITGGGGIVLSRVLLGKLAKSKACECPSLSSPDDMHLGVCFAQLGVEITHSPLFHQARPMDYASEYLQHQHVVSFHKHWMIDPIIVYNTWFSDTNKRVEL